MNDRLAFVYDVITLRKAYSKQKTFYLTSLTKIT